MPPCPAGGPAGGGGLEHYGKVFQLTRHLLSMVIVANIWKS